MNLKNNPISTPQRETSFQRRARLKRRAESVFSPFRNPRAINPFPLPQDEGSAVSVSK